MLLDQISDSDLFDREAGKAGGPGFFGVELCVGSLQCGCGVSAVDPPWVSELGVHSGVLTSFWAVNTTVMVCGGCTSLHTLSANSV